jgi:hypothetical protein
MLHEVLFALLGQTGSVVAKTKTGFKIAEYIDFITSSERQILDKVVILGYQYS